MIVNTVAQAACLITGSHACGHGAARPLERLMIMRLP